jgi:hypothetical protein
MIWMEERKFTNQNNSSAKRGLEGDERKGEQSQEARKADEKITQL